ncbi:MAG: hypothetical protein B6229_00675 [Spirochaetaceae bacterium 4572_7]|nr:MAG: hypothetical protein B6229_00675 [Spirochaetaceae bacterium 4572_7]
MSSANVNVINSIIGNGTVFTGDLDLTGLLKIDGDFSGSIKAEGKVLIGNSGRAKCSIFAKTVVVGGVVKGDIYAEDRVVILSTGMVIGNIRSPRLVMEEGVLFNGEVTIILGKSHTEDIHTSTDSKTFSPFQKA